MMKYIILSYFLLAFTNGSFAQSDTLSGSAEVNIVANKWEQKQNEIPNKITKVSKKDIQFQQPATTADLLIQTGTVYVQKSQLGGGSPMIRGFATNRVLISVDGVRMNNAIYRSGNLQNVLSIDALATETAEVVFGPGSLVYGSDAIGGVMDFHSLEVKYQKPNSRGWLIDGNAQLRFASAANERTAHANFNTGSKRFAYLGSVTFSQFGDLKMGKNGGQSDYLRPEYVVRENGQDKVVPNANPHKQVFSGYSQWNVLQKFRYHASANIDLQYSFFYGAADITPRYDRLIEYRNGRLRYAEWNYGPQIWRMHQFKANFTRKTKMYDELRFIAAFQDYDESRMDRSFNSINRRILTEKVKLFTLNLDGNKAAGKNEWYYGLEANFNKVFSTGHTTNIETGNKTNVASRYPNGSSLHSFGAYGSYKWNFRPKFTFTGGARLSYSEAKANFNSTFFPFPYKEANLKDAAPTVSIGLVYRPANKWQLNANISTGFRVPNIDDFGKLFESVPGQLTVPNPNLESEYAWNYEIGMVRNSYKKIRLELNLFHTRLNNAIVRRPSTFNGNSTILYEGVLSNIEALQNVGKATVTGLQAAIEIWVSSQISIFSVANYVTGKETDDKKNEQVPLRHAPPFYGSSGIRFDAGPFRAEVNSQYNSEISNENLAPSEQIKTNIYAKDAQGRPYSPRWYTLNARASYIYKNAKITIGLENLTNQRYRTYSSGIVAPGLNAIISLGYSL